MTLTSTASISSTSIAVPVVSCSSKARIEKELTKS